MMQQENMPDLRSYIETGDAITKSILDSESSLYKGIETYYDFFRQELIKAEAFTSPLATLVFMNACLIFASSVRMALTGHAAATAPLFRTALEAACYGYLMNHSQDAERIWSNRHQSKEAEKKCRDYFSKAISKVAETVANTDKDARFKEWLTEGYQATIDWGAHPNPRSIFSYLDFHDRDDDYVQLNLTGLHGPDSPQMHRHLIGCMDYGLLIAVIIAKSVKKPTEELSEKLHALNALKESLLMEYFEAEPLQ